MERDTLISVIMPVYNVDKYLRKSIESILDQTFKNFELLIIDDGSTDTSPIICDEYAQKDSRIIVKHIANQGVANARNLGIELSKGKYIYFVDSDDYLDSDMLNVLYSNIEKYNTQLVISGFHMDYCIDGKIIKYEVEAEFKVFESFDNFIQNAYEYIKKNLINTPWNKLYLKEIIQNNGIKFKKRFGEDIFFNIDYLKNIDTIMFVNYSGYNWNRTREGSETDKIYNDSEKFLIEKYAVFTKILELFNNADIDTIKLVNNYFVSRLIQFSQEIAINKNIKFKDKTNSIKKIFKNDEYLKIIRNVKADSLMMRICYIPLKVKSVALTFVMGLFIGVIKTHFKNFFYNIRNKQVNNSEKGECNKKDVI